MDIAHILEELAYDMGELPREAIEAAVALRGQITPYLIAILKDAILRVDEVMEDDNYQGHLYAMYLLAQFREPIAYPLILELVSFSGEIPHAITGDVLTEDLSRILASVSEEKISPLQAVIENRSLNEYVRAACVDALVILVGSDIVPRETVVDYFSSLFETKLERLPSFVWNQLALSSAMLHPQELVTHILRACHEELVDDAFFSPDDLDFFLATPKENLLKQLRHNTELIEDTVSEMEKWLVVHSSC